MAVSAAVSYLVMAEDNASLIAEAEQHTLVQSAKVPSGQGRSKAFAQIRLARIRFLAGEAEQACDDGNQALQLAEHVTSARIQIRLRELIAASKPYADVPRVAEFRDRLRTIVAQPT